MRKNSTSYIFKSVYQIDMKFDRQLRPATETSWVFSYGGKTIPRWRTAPFWKSIYRHISVKNHPIFMKFCTQQQILNWVNVTWSKMKKLHWTDSEFDRTYFLFNMTSIRRHATGHKYNTSSYKFRTSVVLTPVVVVACLTCQCSVVINRPF